jgi:lipopolysaccharide/colanic/teichoic acid biosynthesis glycosyltransferase
MKRAIIGQRRYQSWPLRWRIALELLLSAVGLLVGAYLYAAYDDGWFLDSSVYADLLLTALCFGMSIQRRGLELRRPEDRQGLPSEWVVVDMLLIGMGISLLLQSVLFYVYLLDPLPWPVLGLGCGLASIFVILLRSVLSRLAPAVRVVVIGPEQERQQAASLGGMVTHVLDTEALPTATTTIRQAAREGPSHAVVAASTHCNEAVVRDLLQWQRSGVVLCNGEELWERERERVAAETIRPTDLRWFTAFKASKRVQATQAIYSNLLGLGLLVLFLPLFLPLALLSRWSAGRGPVLEHTLCAGFQGVPFKRFRFRTHRADDGRITGVGRWLQLFGLDAWPQLVNVVRGEMSLLGPAPIRVEAAEWMRERVPFFAHRFTVRPGLFGWAQLHQKAGEPMEEITKAEYDLYYLKHATVLFDFHILAQTLTQTVLRSGR